MEAWPTVACTLLLTAIVQSRDFTQKDIILLHPSTTPHPGGFKCFTCQDAPDNYECNRWAPDVYCSKYARFCSTLHLMDRHGDSVSVTKRCATLQDCQSTGCAVVASSDHQVCASCCEGNICNLLVPRNQSSAIFSFMSPRAGSGARVRLTVPLFIIITIIAGIFTV